MNSNFLKEKQYEIKGQKYLKEILYHQSKYTSFMEPVQMGFLMSLINDNKFNNVLEIGVFQGVNDIMMIKAGLESNPNFQLFSIEKGTNESVFGYEAMDALDTNEKKHYNLFLGKTSFDINNIIPKDVKFDLVFIDGKHSHPGPLFDLICCIPYLHENSLVFFHDVVNYIVPDDYGSSYVFESWSGDKYRIYNYDYKIFSNMGCIMQIKDKNILLENIETLSKLPFNTDPWFLDVYKHHEQKVGSYKDIEYGLGFNLNDIEKLKIYLKLFADDNYVNKIINNLNNNYHS